MTDAVAAHGKTCFVIGPIGPDNSEIRNMADMFLVEIVEKVLMSEDFGFHQVGRADRIGSPGSITSQIINAIASADLIVADLTRANANAFYELGLSHTLRKPTIHMALEGEELPFDNQEYRTIFYRVDSPLYLQTAREGLNLHVSTVLSDDYVVDNPITQAIGRREIDESGNDRDQLLKDLLERSDRQQNEMREIRRILQNPIPSESNRIGLFSSAFDSPNISSNPLVMQGLGGLDLSQSSPGTTALTRPSDGGDPEE